MDEWILNMQSQMLWATYMHLTLLNIVYMQQSINIADELLYAVSTRKTSGFFRGPYSCCLYRKKKLTSGGHRFETFNLREKQMLNQRKNIQILFKDLCLFCFVLFFKGP